MEVRITPTENRDKLRENLEKRAESIKEENGELVAEIDPATVARTPGVESYSVNGEKREGLKGKPVGEQVYARIEDRQDAVKALVATIEGFNLVVLNTDREWDLRKLREYNPDIKHLKVDEPEPGLGIDKSVEELGIEIPEEEAGEIYREMLC